MKCSDERGHTYRWVRISRAKEAISWTPCRSMHVDHQQQRSECFSTPCSVRREYQTSSLKFAHGTRQYCGIAAHSKPEVLVSG